MASWAIGLSKLKSAASGIPKTVGLDRSSLPLPNVYVGWKQFRPVSLAWKSSTTDIESAPAKGWWWTKDNVELWLSTHAVPADQNTYDANCQQFFFIPNDSSATNGVGGVVGQWHRSRDAIAEQPHPPSAIIQGLATLA